MHMGSKKESLRKGESPFHDLDHRLNLNTVFILA